nr:MLX interacting protein [Hymenolepis microstoma]
MFPVISQSMYEVKKHSEIKSGQFMVSNLDDSDAERDEDEPEIEKNTESVEDLSKAVEFDALPSLFKSLSLAYVGRTVTSPRWSYFMGTGFQLKQKVRLNNIIWREYHMQYVKQHKPVVVKFEVPSAESTNIDRQCLVMNGKFWNQHSKKLTFEYRRWRTFFINHLRPKANSKALSRSDKRHTDFELPLDFPSKIPFVDDRDVVNDVAPSSGIGSPRFLDDLMKEFDGNLDLFLDQPFPDPRDTSMLGNSDIMQPGLTQLQPNSESYRNDLITGLLQQPAMPTIMEDEYSNNCTYNRQPNGSSYSSSQVIHNCQPFAPQLQHSTSNCSYPYSSQSATFRSYHSPEYGYANKSFLGSGATPQPAPCKSIRFAEPETRKQNGGNLALLNALLQKPSSTVSLARRGIRERRHSNSSSVASASSPETASSQTGGSYKRQQSLSAGTPALIVDLSKERMNSPPSGSTGSGSGALYVDDMSSGFVDTSTPSEGSVLDSLQQNRLSGSSLYNYRSSGIIHDRFSSVERMPLSMVQAPTPSPPSTASGTAVAPRQQQQVLQIQNPVAATPPYVTATTTRNDQQQQKLVSPYRRSRSQYHPNPPPYRRPQSGCVVPVGKGISSAPDLYTICPLAQQVHQNSPECGDIHHTVASDDIEESLEQDDLLLDETNDDTDFDGCLMTSEDGGGPSGGLVDDEDEDEEDIKSSYLITPHSTTLSINSSSASAYGGGKAGSPTGSFHQSGNTEQRRRMSMQSSLKLLQDLVRQNQERRCLDGSGRKPPIVSGSGITSQLSHGHNPPHHQKTSKAAILRDGAELIRSQRVIGDRLDAQISSLQAELDSLHESVNACCKKLPTLGAVSKQQAKSMKSAARVWYHNFVSQATEANWKFYLFSLIFTDVFETYCDKVCCSSSREVLRRSTISWLEDHCDLPQLRKLMAKAICNLSTTTNALQQPNLLPHQAREAAARLAALHSTTLSTAQHGLPYSSNSSSLSTSSLNYQHFKSITNSSPPAPPSTANPSALLSSNPPTLTHVTPLNTPSLFLSGLRVCAFMDPPVSSSVHF